MPFVNEFTRTPCHQRDSNLEVENLGIEELMFVITELYCPFKRKNPIQIFDVFDFNPLQDCDFCIESEEAIKCGD